MNKGAYKAIGLLFFILIFFCSSMHAQSLIVGIPSADIADKNQLEFTHETQSNFWKKPGKWNSFNFICFGLTETLELTATLNNLDNDGSKNLVFGLGAKKVFNLSPSVQAHQGKIILGTNVLYSIPRNNFGVWSYGLLSLRIPGTKTRFTGGISYGTYHAYGFRYLLVDNIPAEKPNNIGSILLGVEQPITNQLSIIADWYSGKHALAAFIPAIQLDIGHSVWIAGYKIPNSKEAGDNAVIVELMVNIPTKKVRKH